MKLRVTEEQAMKARVTSPLGFSRDLAADLVDAREELAEARAEIARLQAELDGRGEEIMVREGIVRHKNASHAACVVLDRDERADDEDEIAELFCGTDLTALDGHRVAVIVRDLGKP